MPDFEVRIGAHFSGHGSQNGLRVTIVPTARCGESHKQIDVHFKLSYA